MLDSNYTYTPTLTHAAARRTQAPWVSSHHDLIKCSKSPGEWCSGPLSRPGNREGKVQRLCRLAQQETINSVKSGVYFSYNHIHWKGLENNWQRHQETLAQKITDGEGKTESSSALFFHVHICDVFLITKEDLKHHLPVGSHPKFKPQIGNSQEGQSAKDAHKRGDQGDSEGHHSRCLDLAELWYLFFLLSKDEPVGHDSHDERKQNHVRRAEKRHFFGHCLSHGGTGVFVRVPHNSDRTVRREKWQVSERRGRVALGLAEVPI